MNTVTWLKGLGVAVTSALITSALAMPVAPDTFNFSRTGLEHLAILAAPIAAKAVLLYLKQSPLQPAVTTPKA